MNERTALLAHVAAILYPTQITTNARDEDGKIELALDLAEKFVKAAERRDGGGGSSGKLGSSRATRGS